MCILVPHVTHLVFGFSNQKGISHNMKETRKSGEKASMKNKTQQPGVRSKESVVSSVAIISVEDKHSTF